MVSEKWEMDATMSALVGAVIIPNNIIEKSSSTVLLEKYSNFSDVFDKVHVDKLPRHSKYDLAIKTEEGKQLLFSLTYDHSQLELNMLCKYIDEMLGKRFIMPSKSPAETPVLFTKKKNSELRLCVNYRSLNAITKKNKHLLPLVQTVLDLVGRKKRYTKLNIISAYYALRIRAGDEWKTAFKCRYNHFEYRVVPFRLVNAPAAFQAYIKLILCEYMNQFVVAYLDNIVVYLDTIEKHT